MNNAFDLFRKIKPIFRATKLIRTELYQVVNKVPNQARPPFNVTKGEAQLISYADKKYPC